MPPLIPKGDGAVLIRVDSSDAAAWRACVDAVLQENAEGFRANLTVVEDPAWAGASVQDVVAAHAGDTERVVAFVFDAAAVHDKKRRALLCIDLSGKKPRTMRVLYTEVWSVENNLSLGNMEWRDFAVALKGGVFEGFP